MVGIARSQMEIRPFSEDLIPQAAALLAARQARLRQVDPALPGRYEAPAAAQAGLAALWSKPQTTGVVAFEGDRMLAYMIGSPKPEPVWGRNAWVHSTGLALAEGVDPSLVADLYAVLGEEWVREGVFFHFAMTPVADPAIVQAWFALSFGIEQVQALADLRDLKPSPPAPPGLTIRRAGPEDAGVLAGFSELIWRELVKAPVWGITLPEAAPVIRAGYAELAADPTVTVWMAEVDRRVVAIQGYWEPDDPDGVLVPEKSVTISVFSTLPRNAAKGSNPC